MLNPRTFDHDRAFGTQAWADHVSKTVYVLIIQRTKFGNSNCSDIRGKFQESVAESL